jgi:hypothetical protein
MFDRTTINKSLIMKYIFACIFLAFLVPQAAGAQKYLTKNGTIRFYSDAPLEKIEAQSRQVNSALDAASGSLVFKVLMKSFEFQKALMQEHFNENYVESDKYPTATFAGKVTNMKEVDLSKDGSYPVAVEGKLTLHGVTKPIKENGTFEVKQGRLAGKSKFILTLADFNISIPGAVINNIGKTVEVTVEISMDKTIP